MSVHRTIERKRDFSEAEFSETKSLIAETSENEPLESQPVILDQQVHCRRTVRTCFSRRCVVNLFMISGAIILSLMRANVSIALICMTTAKNHTLQNGTTVNEPAEFDWNSKQIGFILSSFFYGYLFCPIGGWMASRFGGTRMFISGLFLNSVFSNVTPWVVNRNGFYVMLGLVFLQGMFQGLAQTSLAEILSQWFPPDERSRAAAFNSSGQVTGVTASYAISSYLAKNYGWRYVYYAAGGVSLIWCLLSSTCITPTPAHDTWISDEERQYLKENIRIKQKIDKYPWFGILTSKPVLAFFFFRFCQGFTSVFIRNTLPMYASDVLHYDAERIGFISAGSVFMSVIACPIISTLKDYVRNKNYLNKTNTTKVILCVGETSVIILLSLAAFSKQEIVIIGCMYAFQVFNIGTVVAINVNGNELSAEYASVITGFMGVFFILAQLIGPAFVGFVVTSHEPSQWTIVLCTIATMQVLGTFVFIIFGSSERQTFERRSPSLIPSGPDHAP